MEKYQIKVSGKPSSKEQFIKQLRTFGKLSLKKCESIYLIFNRKGSFIIMAGIDKKMAEQVSETLLATGVQTEIMESSIDVPMIASPEITKLFEWQPFKILTEKG